MLYGIIGATVHQESLSVFYEGLDDNRLTSFEQALQRTITLLAEELRGTAIAEFEQIATYLQSITVSNSRQLNQLSENTSDCLQVSWLDDTHFIINAMDQHEVYQLHLEVLPLTMMNN
ncbi:MAG: hypothetical protein H9901_01585 [Candidatus Paralactobacillus gallistercoris]|uniref:Uncharacterized protein n=1 Tax=Candidatus Paralactobacillus gallistercoris TaxID=2838724 RepID=A0A948TIX6_9LACO|nr:hypothetical protein [Candidatus Paralactobacillus gallistercoris]